MMFMEMATYKKSYNNLYEYKLVSRHAQSLKQ